MIRAFAVAVGIGTIRIWLAVTMHVAAGEWWLWRTPALNG